MSDPLFAPGDAALTDLIHCLFHRLGTSLKDLHWESRYLLDSFPVAVCDNIRIKRCRIVKDEQYRGAITSKRRYFYGVRVQILATSSGIPVEFCILPGACADLQGLAELALDLPEMAQLFVDAGYNFYEWEDYLLEMKELSCKFRESELETCQRAVVGNL